MTSVLEPQTALQAHMQGLDAIVAVTENNINANLKFLYGANQGIKTRIDIRIEKEDAELHAVIAPPKVKLRVDGQPHAVVFILTLIKGNFEYWTGHGRNQQKQTLAIDHWTVGFKVNLNLADAASLPPAVQAQVKNLGAGMFSVRQLFMDFQNANLAEWDKASTVLPASMQGDSDAQGYFLMYMNHYLNQARTSGDNILGYAIRVTNPNALEPEHPTLPPTDLTFSTNRFMPDGMKPADESRLDTLNFLMMTQRKNFPANVGLWAGNWVTSPDVYGAIAISRDAFVNGYLLPTLAGCANLTTTLTPIDDRRVRIATMAGAPFAVTSDGGTFSSPDNTRVLPSYEGWGNTFPSDHTWRVSHSCRVSIGPSSRVITVNGHSEVFYSVQVWAGIKGAALDEYASQKSEVTWSATITLDSVANGSLTVLVAVNIPDPVQSDDGNWIGKIEKLLNPNFAQHGKDVAEILRKTMRADTLATRLTQALTTHNRFVFPGGQQFTMYDAVFNNDRDLIAKIKYNFY